MTAAAQVADVRAALVDAQRRTVELATALTDAQWKQRPPSGGWSAAECIAHLTLTTDAYIPLLDAAASAVPRTAVIPSSYGRGIRGAFLEWILEPPARGRAKTLPAFVPTADAPKAETIAAFDASQRALLGWIDRHPGVPLDAMTIASPFSSTFRYNAFAALRIIAAHQRRHLWQAERAARGIP